MSPQSDNATHLVDDETVPIIKSENVISEPAENQKFTQREYIFARAENPFNLGLPKFHWIWLGTAHIFAAYFLYLGIFAKKLPYSAVFFEFIYGYLGGLGITVGCHRYWTHKAFKAKLPLQIILMVMQTIANQGCIHKWCLDHRVHHKYTDTDADPHNSNRGFWFSHMGWMFQDKHKDCTEKLRTFDMSDLEKDPVVRFQARWYWTLITIFHWILPMSIIHYFWGAPLLHNIALNCGRFIFSLHITCSVNSFAHMWGDKPYDKNITSVENAIVSFFTVGEGWHNFHHSFPFDYKASEFGWKLNISTMFIDFFASFGWAYDLKTVSQKVLTARMHRTGDGSHQNSQKQLPPPPVPQQQFDSNVTTNIGCCLKSTTTFTELVKPIVDNHVWSWNDGVSDEFRIVSKSLR